MNDLDLQVEQNTVPSIPTLRKPNPNIRNRVIHVLSVYPKISPSMLQVALGIKARIWQPELEQMISEGIVCRDIIVVPHFTGNLKKHTALSLDPSRREKLNGKHSLQAAAE